jgi:hypothetical protein
MLRLQIGRCLSYLLPAAERRVTWKHLLREIAWSRLLSGSVRLLLLLLLMMMMMMMSMMRTRMLAWLLKRPKVLVPILPLQRQDRLTWSQPQPASLM